MPFKEIWLEKVVPRGMVREMALTKKEGFSTWKIPKLHPSKIQILRALEKSKDPDVVDVRKRFAIFCHSTLEDPREIEHLKKVKKLNHQRLYRAMLRKLLKKKGMEFAPAPKVSIYKWIPSNKQ